MSRLSTPKPRAHPDPVLHRSTKPYRPCEDPKVIFPVHQHLITRQGIYIIENVKTDEIVERKLWESTIVILPTKFRGATGSPVRIIALL